MSVMEDEQLRPSLFAYGAILWRIGRDDEELVVVNIFGGDARNRSVISVTPQLVNHVRQSVGMADHEHYGALRQSRQLAHQSGDVLPENDGGLQMEQFRDWRSS